MTAPEAETSEPAADQPAPLSELSPDELKQIQASAQEALAHIELVNVYPIHIEAFVTDDSDSGASTSATLNIATSYATEVGAYANRITFAIDLLDADESALGHIEFTLMIDYRVDEGYRIPDDAADYIASTTGAFGAYPYARELAQSLSTRLQFDPFVLGLLHRSGAKPRAVTRVPSRDARVSGADGEAGEGAEATSTMERG